MARHMFAGGTTPIGLVNFFDQIMPLEKAKKRYFLKGSPGSGKSTFMKKIAAALENAGFETDIYHCANDAGSLDGVSAAEKGFCVIDGTAPHVSDPEAPIAVDMLIDFADFIEESKVLGHTAEIKSLLRKKKLLTEKARGFFTAAGNVYSAERKAYEAALNKSDLLKLTDKWLRIFDNTGKHASMGTDRKMFLTAVTPDGVVSFADTVLGGYTVYGLYVEAGAGTDIFLEKMKDYAISNGINTESFYCPLEPGKLDYLLLPEIKTAFAVSGGRWGYSGHTDEIIDFGCCYNMELLGNAKTGQKKSEDLFDQLLDESIALMKESRILHSGIERIYIHAIDFDRINNMTDKVIDGLLS